MVNGVQWWRREWENSNDDEIRGLGAWGNGDAILPEKEKLERSLAAVEWSLTWGVQTLYLWYPHTWVEIPVASFIYWMK